MKDFLKALILPPTTNVQYAFDYHPERGDVFACVADIGWITGHSYVVYGPLCNGGTTVLFESVPTYPNPGNQCMQLLTPCSVTDSQVDTGRWWKG